MAAPPRSHRVVATLITSLGVALIFVVARLSALIVQAGSLTFMRRARS